MRRNIDAWWPAIEAGAEAIITSASGCGATVAEYGDYLAHDPRYAERAAIRGEFLGQGMEMIAKPFAMDVLSAKIREMIEAPAPTP